MKTLAVTCISVALLQVAIVLTKDETTTLEREITICGSKGVAAVPDTTKQVKDSVGMRVQLSSIESGN